MSTRRCESSGYGVGEDDVGFVGEVQVEALEVLNTVLTRAIHQVTQDVHEQARDGSHDERVKPQGPTFAQNARYTVIQIAILAVFFGGLVIGSIVADSFGVLPTAEQLQEEDRERLQRWQSSR